MHFQDEGMGYTLPLVHRQPGHDDPLDDSPLMGVKAETGEGDADRRYTADYVHQTAADFPDVAMSPAQAEAYFLHKQGRSRATPAERVAEMHIPFGRFITVRPHRS